MEFNKTIIDIGSTGRNYIGIDIIFRVTQKKDPELSSRSPSFQLIVFRMGFAIRIWRPFHQGTSIQNPKNPKTQKEHVSKPWSSSLKSHTSIVPALKEITLLTFSSVPNMSIPEHCTIVKYLSHAREK